MEIVASLWTIQEAYDLLSSKNQKLEAIRNFWMISQLSIYYVRRPVLSIIDETLKGVENPEVEVGQCVFIYL